MNTINNWDTTWPTDPGIYLFCCRLKGEYITNNRARLIIVRASKNFANQMTYTGGGMIIFKEEWEGVWQSFNIEFPDLDKLLGEG